MTAHELQEIFRELPAGTFTLHVAERTPIEVSHTDFAMLSPGGEVLIVWDTERHLHYINAPAITRIAIKAPVGQGS